MATDRQLIVAELLEDVSGRPVTVQDGVIQLPYWREAQLVWLLSDSAGVWEIDLLDALGSVPGARFVLLGSGKWAEEVVAAQALVAIIVRERQRAGEE